MICKYCQCLDFSSAVCHYKCSLTGLVGPKAIMYALIYHKITTNITINVQQALFTNPLAAHSRVSETEPHLNTNLLKYTNSVKSPTVNFKLLILSVLLHQQYNLHFSFLTQPIPMELQEKVFYIICLLSIINNYSNLPLRHVISLMVVSAAPEKVLNNWY